jgi:hypothetical protein
MTKLTLLILACALSCAAQAYLPGQPVCPLQPSASVQCIYIGPTPAAGVLGWFQNFFHRNPLPATTSVSMTLGYSANSGPQGNPAIPAMQVGSVWALWPTPTTHTWAATLLNVSQWSQTVDSSGNSILTVTVPTHMGQMIEAVGQ